LPLFGQPGLELALGVSALLTVGGMALGATAVAEVRKPPRLRVPRVEPSGPGTAVWTAIAAAFLLGASAAALPFFAAVALTLATTPCSPWAQAIVYPLLVLPTALLAASTGVFARTLFPGRMGTLAVCLALLLSSLAWTVWPIAVGPQVFAYNFYLGWFPGPLYDEALHVSGALMWFRLESVLWAVLLALAATLLFLPTGHTQAGRGRGLPAFVAVLLAIALLELHAVDLGFRSSEAHVQQVLGGRGETAHAELFFPAEKPEEQLDRLRRDVEFRWEQVAQFLGGAPSGKVRLYLFRSPEEKERLVGASGTQFTKGLALYLNDAPFPNPVLEHELVHALASRFGKGPWGATVRFGIIPVMGVVEGVAEAPQQTRGDLTLHEWAAGMRREKLMPDIRELFRPAGFYLSAPDRAYTAAGSFIRWLRDSYGPAKLQALLAHADFQGVYGQPLDTLAGEWERMLDAIQLDDRSVNRAFSRFRQGSVFARACAREVAGLSAEARSEPNPLRALEQVRRCVVLQPDEPSFALLEASLLQRLGRQTEAGQLLQQLQARVEGLPALEVETGLARVRLAFLSGDWDDAASLLEQLASAKPGLNLERQVAVWRGAETAGDAGKMLMAYLARPDEVREMGLQRAVALSPEQPLVHYLLGRRFLELGAPGAAGAHLRTALALGLPPPVDREAWRLRVSADYLAGDCGAVADDAGQLPDFGAGLRSEVTEWQARCAFDVKTFKGPLVPTDPFR
jgi:tetratricopeptide (TPR) repeat protein